MRPVRNVYEDEGVEDYYKNHGKDYRNPHERRIRLALRKGLFKWRPQLKRILDLSCGSGEVTMIFRELGVNTVEGIDPYTYEAYEARTGQKCEKYNFDEISRGEISDRQYSLIVCSYGMHLAEKNILPSLCQQLAIMAPQLIIVTPHKQPVLKDSWGWKEVEEIVLDRVHVRLLKSDYHNTEEKEIEQQTIEDNNNQTGLQEKEEEEEKNEKNENISSQFTQ